MRGSRGNYGDQREEKRWGGVRRRLGRTSAKGAGGRSGGDWGGPGGKGIRRGLGGA